MPDDRVILDILYLSDYSILVYFFFPSHLERDNVVYWKTNRKIINDLQ